MNNYAAGTSVSAEKSKAEIEATLRRYGADQFIAGWHAGAAMLGFRMGNKAVRFVLPLPTAEEFATIKVKPTRMSAHNRERTPAQVEAVLEQETRRRFRALALVIKAKLEAVASKITSFEEEFLAHIILPGGKTVYEETRARIEHAVTTGAKPELLLGYGGPKA